MVIEREHLSPQQLDVLDHMVTIGPITSLDAINRYGVTRLSAVIYTLRNEHGIEIDSVHKKVTNRHGQKTHVAEYSLA